MYKYLILSSVFFCFLLNSCGNSKEANILLTEAQTMYDNKEFVAAKNMIDSINNMYPREIEVRKKALTLMRQVEIGESEQNIVFCDSLLPIRISELEGLKKGFVFEKDTAYNETGNFIRSTMTVEKNVERSYIRCGVNEEGEMYMASVYFGSRPIEHTGLKFSTNNGDLAETPSIPYDGGLNYRFKDLGNTTEVVTYKGNHCKAIANFVNIKSDQRIKAEYTGGKTFTLYLSDNDKKGIIETYNLALVLSEINAMQKEKEKSLKRIERISEKLSVNEAGKQ
jgi:hypothetical protein